MEVGMEGGLFIGLDVAVGAVVTFMAGGDDAAVDEGAEEVLEIEDVFCAGIVDVKGIPVSVLDRTHPEVKAMTEQNKTTARTCFCISITPFPNL
jgi:hypothetical protein